MKRLIASGILLLALITATNASQVYLGAILMQLRSDVDSTSDSINSNIQSILTNYLDAYFGAFYKDSEPKDYFERSSLLVSSYGVHGVAGSFITTLEIDGILDFSYDPPPSSDFIDTLLKNAFEGPNEHIFIEYLLKSDEEFLQRLTHVILEIDYVTVVEAELRDVIDGSNVDGTASANKDSDDINGSEDQSIFSETGAMIAISVAAGISFFIVLISCVCIVKRAYCKKTNKIEDVGCIEDPIKVIELPVKSSQQRQTSNNATETIPQATLHSGTADGDDERTKRLQSSECSVASHDSSKLTYITNTSKVSFGSFSRFSIDMPSIDLGVWQKPNAVAAGFQVPPFGNDISAIESHRDLSLIEEEENEGGCIYAGVMGNRSRSRESLATSNEKRSSSRDKTVVSSDYPYSQYKHANRHGNGSQDSTDESSEVNASSDVISDLKNLSIQIEKQRKSRRSVRQQLD